MEKEQSLRSQVKEEIYTYGVGFRRSTLFLIRERHPKIDLSGIDFFSLKGAEIPDKDDGEEEDDEPTEQEVLVDDQGGASDRIRMVNPENLFLETSPTVVQTITSVSKATAVPVEVIPMVAPEDLLVAEAVSDVLIPVESADNVSESCDVDNVSKSSDVIINPSRTEDE